MASETLCTDAENELLSKSEGHNQMAQVECGSRFHNINGQRNVKKDKSDNLSENIGQKASLQLRVVSNANDNSGLDDMHKTCDASNSEQHQEPVKPQRQNTLHDLYMQGQYDDENDEDDSDWEPVGHFVIKKWFCANCTMANFDDVNHCEVCGEDKDSGLFEYDLARSRLVNDVHHAIDSGTIHINQVSSSKTKTAIGFDERMLLHAEVEMKSHPHPERPDRLRAIASSFVAAGIFRGNCTLIQAREITEEELQLVHSLDHIQEVQQTSNLISSYFTPDTYANEHSACAARLAAGLCADLARAILDGSAKNGFALVRPPGHHAGVKQAMGFCLHNNAAVATLAAQTAGAKKVLIVDWDVHHGNGTQEIFDGNNSVLYISLHRHENGRFYPGTGAVNEIGVLNGKGYSVNIPWSRGGVGDNDYIYAFQRVVLPIASEFAPDITIVSAGFDAARGDPLGCCDITPAGYAQMTHMLTRLSEGKMLVILEGGYNLRSISSSAVAVVKVLLGEIPNSEMTKVIPSKAGVQTILEVLKVQHMYWPSLTPGYMELQAEWSLVTSNKNQKKRKRLVGPLWWKWGSKRFVYKLIYRRLYHKGHLML